VLANASSALTTWRKRQHYLCSTTPESANNAGAQTSFIPMLTLGIPSNPVMALMIGAMIIQGIQPGPSVITQQPALFWGIIVSMWIGNFFLLVLNLPLIGLWVRMIMIPYHFLYPLILVFCAIGVFSLNNSTFDIYLTALFGILGYVFAKLGCEGAPMLLGFILGPLMEEYLRRALIISRGDPMVFLTRPISASMLALALIAMASVLRPAVRKKRVEAFQEDCCAARKLGQTACSRARLRMCRNTLIPLTPALSRRESKHAGGICCR
jgi:putative tricarboxylic transport membrane protein